MTFLLEHLISASLQCIAKSDSPMSSFTGEIQVRIYRNKIPIVTQPINLSASRFFKADCKEKSLTRKLKPWRFLCCKKAANSHYSCKSARESRQIYRNTQFVAKKRWQRIRPWGATWLTLLLCACALSLVHQKFTQVVDLEDVFRPSAAFLYVASLSAFHFFSWFDLHFYLSSKEKGHQQEAHFPSSGTVLTCP